jgi:hypothetical protein
VPFSTWMMFQVLKRRSGHLSRTSQFEWALPKADLWSVRSFVRLKNRCVIEWDRELEMQNSGLYFVGEPHGPFQLFN